MSVCCVFRLVDLFAELVDKVVDALKLMWDVDALGAVWGAASAPDAVGGLAFPRDGAVVAEEEYLPVASVGFSGVSTGGVGISFHREVTFVNALVVVEEVGWDVDAVGAWHAVFAIVAGDGVEAHHLFCDVVEEDEVIVGERLEGGIRREIIVEVLHVCHAAQDGQDERECACVTESP